MAQNDKPDMLFSLGEKLRSLDNPAWDKVQAVLGSALGVGSAACLFLMKSNEGFLSLNLVLALVLALIVPRIITNRLERDFDRGRKFLMVAMLICILAFGGYTILTQGPQAFTRTAKPAQETQQAQETQEESAENSEAQ
ncbi:MAG: hypothetical protein IKE30_02760 [Clostridia bacterium]|nr:hypothetical protein [Clostridia bacterium]